MKLNKQEIGRSLVEMLGVLSIIAILTITSLYGYNYAIDKYRANETINELTQYALIVDGQVLQNRAVFDLSELGETTRLGYPITAYLLDDPSYFELQLEQVPVGVCKRILDSNWNIPLLIRANAYDYNGNLNICEQDDDNTPPEMIFQFAAGMQSGELPYGACETDTDCKGDCVTCEDGLCVSTCTGNARCAQDVNSGEMLCCPKEKREGPYCCETKINGRCCNKYYQCCPWYRPLIDKNGNCYACDYANRIDVTGVQDNCNVCSNRELDGNWCRIKCTADKPLRDAYGVCRSCDDEAFIYLGSYLRQNCTTVCPNRHSSGGNNNYCGLKCGEGLYADKPLTDASGICHSCEETGNIEVTNVHENCAVCSNREIKGNLCALPCPDPNKPMPGIDGKCYACDDPKPLNATKLSCSICPNRINHHYHCILPCGEGIYANKPLVGADGYCYSCDEPKTVNVEYNTANCQAVCPNREVLGVQCILNNCEKHQMKGEDGKCYDCDAPNDALIKTQMCDKCPNRVKWNDYCILPCDEGIYEDMPLPDRYGECYACDDSRRIDVYPNNDVCQKVCPDRQLDSHYCILTGE